VVRAACAERDKPVNLVAMHWCRPEGHAQVLLCACVHIHEAVGMMG